MSKHSPLPWKHKTEDGTLGSIIDANDDPVGHTFGRLNDPYHIERQTNAELIVKAVNAYSPDRNEAYQAMRVAVGFLMSQVKLLAERAFSEGVPEWLEKCDAYQCGKRALLQADRAEKAEENLPCGCEAGDDF